MNEEDVCRTAPATPGLLMTEVLVEQPLALPGSAKYQSGNYFNLLLGLLFNLVWLIILN